MMIKQKRRKNFEIGARRVGRRKMKDGRRESEERRENSQRSSVINACILTGLVRTRQRLHNRLLGMFRLEMI